MDDILFSCVGTSDPVRGERDGGILHIMRYYHPKKVYLFMSSEMSGYERDRHYFEKTFQYVRTHWTFEGKPYCPEKDICHSGLDDVSKLDLVEKPLQSYFEQAVRENPDCRILINLSSGTPQMKSIMSYLAIESLHSVLGIQVDNPEQKSGDTPRSNSKNYDIDDELEGNVDELPEFLRNRTSEPKMIALQNQNRRQQMLTLLKRRDYDAMLTIAQNLPQPLPLLVAHLAARNSLRMQEAYELSRKLPDLGFPLYLPKTAPEAYRELSEYYLLLRNLQLTGRYSEFVLRLNPFLTELLLAMLKQTRYASLIRASGNRVLVALDKLENPAERSAIERELNGSVNPNSSFSVHLGVVMMVTADVLSKEQADFLQACDNLNMKQRNAAAHQLHAVQEEDIERDCEYVKHFRPAAIVQQLGSLLKWAYPEVCDMTLYRVYDRCEDYIRKHLYL